MHGADWCEAAGQSEPGALHSQGGFESSLWPTPQLHIHWELCKFLKDFKSIYLTYFRPCCELSYLEAYHNSIEELAEGEGKPAFQSQWGNGARMVSLLLALYLFDQDYPADISMFKEMVQNADDAGATEAGMARKWY